MVLRDRMVVGLAVSLTLGALVWWLALSPAIMTWHQAPGRHAVLDAHIEQMHALADEAQALQKMPRLGPEDSRRVLGRLVTQTLGTAGEMTVHGDRATVVLKGASAEALTALLAQTRQNARVLPVRADFVRNDSRSGWDGSLVLALPQP